MEKQEELFGEFNQIGPKNAFFRKGALPERTFTFTFSYEKFILLILGFIILGTALFAIGFERGRRRPIARQRAAVKAAPLIAPAPPATQKPYTIQAATFKSKELARRETEKLRKKGFSTMIIGINGVYQIWVGEYANHKEASGALSALRKIYKDCYIRKR